MVQLQHYDCLGASVHTPSDKTPLWHVLLSSITHPQFLALVPQPAKTWRAHTFLQPPPQPAPLQSETFIGNCCEFSINFCEGGFHPYPAVSIRHLVTCMAQIGACQILNEKDGSNWVCLCLSHRKRTFHFFIVFASFKMRAGKMPLK